MRLDLQLRVNELVLDWISSHADAAFCQYQCYLSLLLDQPRPDVVNPIKLSTAAIRKQFDRVPRASFVVLDDVGFPVSRYVIFACCHEWNTHKADGHLSR